MRKTLWYSHLLFACIWSMDAIAKTLPLFEDKTPLTAVLTAPLSDVYRDKKNELRAYHAGSFVLNQDAQGKVRVPVNVRTRGNFRRLNCALPPLQLNFVKKQNTTGQLQEQNKLKLVGPCKNTPLYHQFVGLEYLAYQFYEVLSPDHFKTRLVNLSYLDANKKRKPYTVMTFLIEDISEVARRSNKQQILTHRVRRDSMDLAHTAKVELFQYMIGNIDYSTLKTHPGQPCCHNARLLGPKDGIGDFISVPYDFDTSGLVDAPYAPIPDSVPIKDVRSRYFLGWCKEDKHFLAAVDHFKSKKFALFAEIDKAPIINDKNRLKATRYLERFFATLDDPDKVQKEIVGRCRGKVIKG